MITSKVSRTARTTIPQPVRVALGLKEGDEVAYQIEGDRAVLTNARPTGLPEDPFTTFVEWNSPADRKDYADL